MTILDTCIEMNAIAAQGILQTSYQHVGILGFQTTGAMILQDFAFKAYQIAAQGQVTLLQRHTNTGSFQWTASFIDKMLVITQDTAISHFASGMEAVRDGLQAPVAAQAG